MVFNNGLKGLELLFVKNYCKIKVFNMKFLTKYLLFIKKMPFL